MANAPSDKALADLPRVLVADDEPAFALPLAELLRREGFAAEAVLDSAAVRLAIGAQGCDVLVTDINMPGNTGLELVRELATGENAIPIILLTGSPTVATAARAVQLGAVAYLLKPIDFDELLALVRRAAIQGQAQRLLREQRGHLQRWQQELDAMAAELRRLDAESGDPAADFVTMSATNLMGALLDFRRATELLNSAPRNQSAVWHANTVKALEKSVDILERTRRNFKSTELRDLRHEIQSLLDALPDRTRQ